MIGKIIIENRNDSVTIKDAHSYADVENEKKQSEYIASAWDYAARIGNPINFYFREA